MTRGRRRAIRVVVASLAVLGLSMAACSTDDDVNGAGTPTVAATDAAGPTGDGEAADEVTFTRETQEAVARCVDAMRDVGGELTTYDTSLWLPSAASEAIEVASTACDEALLQIEVDGTDESGDTPDNQAAVLITSMNFDLASLNASILTDDTEAIREAREYYRPTNELVETGVYEWADELTTIIEEHAE